MASRREAPQPIRSPGPEECPYCGPGSADRLIWQYDYSIRGARADLAVLAVCEVHGLVTPVTPVAPSIPGFDNT
jgi:hypothetical protein